MNWFTIGKQVYKGCILLPWLFNLYVMQNAELYESQSGIRIARGNINNLRYAGDITSMVEWEKEL